MALLQASTVHIDQPLSNLTIAFLQNTKGFVADQVFPRVSVMKKSDRYYVWPRGQFNQMDDIKERAPYTMAPEVGLTLSTDSYSVRVYSEAAPIDFETAANADAMLNVKAALAAQKTQRFLIHREQTWADRFFTTGVWATDWAGVSAAPTTNQVRQWSDYVNSTPITDVVNIMRTMQLRSGGFRPNVMVVGKEVRDILINHPTILSRLNGGATVSNPALVTDAKLAEIFGVEKFLVMEAVRNTAKEGLTETNAFIGGKSAAFYYVPPSAGIMVASAGMTFTWDELEHASGYGITIKSYTGDWLAERGIAEKLEVNMAYDQKVVATDLGGFIATVIA